MDPDLVLGLAITVLAIVTVIALYAWSSRIIENIHAKKLTSLRRILKERGHGRRRR